MRSSWSEPYLWLHLAGIAAVPLLLELCLVGLVASHSWLAVGLVAIAGIAPIVWMQWQRPFSIFSLVVVALKPSQMTEMQRRILGQFKLPIGKVVTVITAVLALVLLWKLQQWVPAVTQPIDLPAGPLGGLLLAAVAFLLTNLFLQVPASVLPVLLTTDSQLGAPYPVAQIPQDFTLLGFQLKQILPIADLPAVKTPAAESSSAESSSAESPIVKSPVVKSPLPTKPLSEQVSQASPSVSQPSSQPATQAPFTATSTVPVASSPVAQVEEAKIIEEIAAPSREVEEIKTEIFEAEILEAIEANQVEANQVEPFSKVSEPIEAPVSQPAISDLELPASTHIQQSQLTVSDPSPNSRPNSSPNVSDTVVTVRLAIDPPLESATSPETDLPKTDLLADPTDLDAQLPHVKHTIVAINQDNYNQDDYH